MRNETQLLILKKMMKVGRLCNIVGVITYCAHALKMVDEHIHLRIQRMGE